MNPPLETLAGIGDPPSRAAAQPLPPITPLPIAPAEERRLKSEVVLVTHNSEADLARSLPAIQEAAALAGADLLFIDLGSVDGSRSFAERHAPGARGVWLEEGDGLAEALSAAAGCSDADVLVVLRPTVQPCAAEGIVELVDHLADHPYTAIVAPALRAQTGGVLGTAKPRTAGRPYSRVEWVVSEAIAVRRSDVGAVLGFRRAPAHSFEQLELCINLRVRGREIHYLPKVEWLDGGGRAAKRLRSGQRGLSVRAWRLLAAHPAYAFALIGRHPVLERASRVLGRCFDVTFSTVALVVLAPLLLAIAAAIRIDSPGPAIFRQRRLGRDARAFQMLKFRTMRHDSDPTLHERFVRDMIVNKLQAEDGGAVQVFKLHPDPRITRLGRALRRTSLDELPQLVNILLGDMTLVGFRPPIPYEVANYPAWYHRRFDGKPGLTGLWQVSGRNQRSYDEMVSLDIEYHNRRSLLLDVLVLLRTVGVVITGRGAY